MTARDAIKIALKSTQGMLEMYLTDLSDADLVIRPVPGANHIAWQLGHLIVAECELIGKGVPGTTYPELPAGFAQQHSKEMSKNDGPTGFRTKQEYLSLFKQMREATLTNLNKMSDADLDKPAQGQMAKFAPTAGALFVLQSNHTIMHAGQFTVLRRKLGKPVVI